MLGEANQALDPIAHIRDDDYLCKNVVISLHPSLYRVLKLTFPQDIEGLTRDGTIDKEMGIGSMHQIVGVLTPTTFSPSTHDGSKISKFKWLQLEV